MLDKTDFLTDRETVEYFNILKEDHKNVMKFAQEAVLKKQQEMDTKRNTKLKDRKSKGKEDYNDSNMSEENDPYPWLDKEGPRRNMTDRGCLEEFIDLSDSDITETEKNNLYKLLYKYKKAFSLRDEIGLCQSVEVELELKDESPFFIRPFPIKKSDKDIVDKEMRKGCLLGILKKGVSSYSSPIMLIPRKLSGIPRIVTDFRHLNSRLVTLQPSIPLVRDAIQILGASGCEILSLADLRDAYHTLRLSETNFVIWNNSWKFFLINLSDFISQIMNLSNSCVNSWPNISTCLVPKLITIHILCWGVIIWNSKIRNL